MNAMCVLFWVNASLSSHVILVIMVIWKTIKQWRNKQPVDSATAWGRKKLRGALGGNFKSRNFKRICELLSFLICFQKRYLVLIFLILSLISDCGIKYLNKMLLGKLDDPVSNNIFIVPGVGGLFFSSFNTLYLHFEGMSSVCNHSKLNFNYFFKK